MAEPHQLAQEQAAKDAELMAKLQSFQASSAVKPNRAMRRLALRHANRTWTGPMTERAKRERRALARKGVVVR